MTLFDLILIAVSLSMMLLSMLPLYPVSVKMSIPDKIFYLCVNSGRFSRTRIFAALFAVAARGVAFSRESCYNLMHDTVEGRACRGIRP